jgi:phospholipid/cholesterol/gamma-HCH transport system substrate-binding protein
MLIERPQWLIGLIAAAVVLAGTGLAMVMTGSTQLVRGTRYEAEFTDASALKSGDFVYVSGVRAGSVTQVRQAPASEDPDHADQGPVVVVEFAVTSGARLPADVRAEIILSNTLGKRGILLRPIDPSPEHLERVGELQSGDGVEITLGRTSTLTDLPEFGEDTTRLLEELDITALRELTTALADVTEDQRDDVDRLLDGVLALSDVLVRRRGELSTALDRAEAVVDVLNSRDQEIVQVIDNFQVTLTTLLRRQSEIERLLVETAGTSTRTADLVSERRAQIDRVVADLTVALERGRCASGRPVARLPLPRRRPAGLCLHRVRGPAEERHRRVGQRVHHGGCHGGHRSADRVRQHPGRSADRRCRAGPTL